MSYVNRKQNEQIAALLAEIEALTARVTALEVQHRTTLVPFVQTLTTSGAMRPGKPYIYGCGRLSD